MKHTLAPVLLAVFIVGSGCYHTTFITGKPPSNTVVEKPWAKSFIAGLVPPEDLDVSQDCPNGVAVVESQLSFLNMVATIVTFHIFSPMHLKVTCAAGGMANEVDATFDVALDGMQDVVIDVDKAINVEAKVTIDPPAAKRQ